MPKVNYSSLERLEAFRLAQEIGQSKAAKELDIPRGTIQGWMVDAQAAFDAVDDDPSLPLDERTDLAALSYFQMSVVARRLALEAMFEGKSRDARELTTTAAIATDKAQLLTGKATSRSESRSLRMSVDGTRLASLLGELPSRSADRPAVAQSRPAAIEAKSSEGATEGFVIPNDPASDQPKRRRSTGGRPRKGPKNVSDTPVVPEGE